VESRAKESIHHSACNPYEFLGAEIIHTSRPAALKYGLPMYYIIGASSESSSNFSRYDCVHFGKRSEASRELAHMYKSTRQFGVETEVGRIGPFAPGKDLSRNVRFQGLFRERSVFFRERSQVSTCFWDAWCNTGYENSQL
jgi:hypothetical protein